MLIPWVKLVPTAISLVEMAGSVLSSNKKENLKRKNADSFDPEVLLKRIEVLESSELKQANLIKQLAQQNLTIIKRVESTYRLAIIGIVGSLVSIFLFLILFFMKL
ncbi:hypothetical protein [Aequorivita capsosiphonis]|uniref:hypothetical protein n=1 Tax=Aequorivita capsosiphonis TaxID=487317 RepID=UPI000479C3BA|nr:hypothetical protein [Aequorivita capsosiphonis]